MIPCSDLQLWVRPAGPPLPAGPEGSAQEAAAPVSVAETRPWAACSAPMNRGDPRARSPQTPSRHSEMKPGTPLTGPMGFLWRSRAAGVLNHEEQRSPGPSSRHSHVSWSPALWLLWLMETQPSHSTGSQACQRLHLNPPSHSYPTPSSWWSPPLPNKAPPPARSPLQSYGGGVSQRRSPPCPHQTRKVRPVPFSCPLHRSDWDHT